jgi:hypothetical protein
MPYMLSLERFAIERTIRQSLFDALEIKYERISEKLAETINSIEEIDALRILLRHAIKCNSLKEFEEKMRSVIE